MGAMGTGEGCWGSGWGISLEEGRGVPLSFGWTASSKLGPMGSVLLSMDSSQALGWGISESYHNPKKGPAISRLWMWKLSLQRLSSLPGVSQLGSGRAGTGF